MKKHLTKRNTIIFSLGIIFTLVIGISIYLLDSKKSECNIQGIKLHGNLVTYKLPDSTEDKTSSEEVIHMIRSANDNENIKVIVIDVDSSGGSLIAGNEIDNAIKHSEKPVIAYIRDLGASASYLAISSSSRIFSSLNSEVGSIGVTASYLNEVTKNEKDGYEYERLVSGKFKDTGAVARRLTNEEREYVMKDLNYNFENFKQAISDNRGIPIEEVNKLSTGATFPGGKALDLKLVDQIGDLYDVNDYLSEFIKEPLYMCWE
ncbi:TPA: signal peptide peptidase SppA [Candidatus Nomurabacteria bacterium]|nr:MAG: hypothetical protein O210_OD1C00001G0607 [Parcubacteria bacterium RAAC4_OD1_1]HCY26171.1 signal peptide peptidase SppA [Candidatus Nomurabacteria bacterium]